LDEYIDNSSFVKNREYEEMHREEIEERVATAAAQVTGRCKGLLELRRNKFGHSGSTVEKKRGGKLVVFTHRSVPEYLATFLRTKETSHVKDFDAIDALIQTLIAVFKALPLDPKHLPDAVGKNLHFLVREVRESVAKDNTPYFESLELLDLLCHRRQLEVHADFDEVRWNVYMPIGTERLPGDSIMRFYEIINVAISFSFYEYMSWKFL
jgi:hypothetical protein